MALSVWMRWPPPTGGYRRSPDWRRPGGPPRRRDDVPVAPLEGHRMGPGPRHRQSRGEGSQTSRSTWLRNRRCWPLTVRLVLLAFVLFTCSLHRRPTPDVVMKPALLPPRVRRRPGGWTRGSYPPWIQGPSPSRSLSLVATCSGGADRGCLSDKHPQRPGRQRARPADCPALPQDRITLHQSGQGGRAGPRLLRRAKDQGGRAPMKWQPEI